MLDRLLMTLKARFGTAPALTETHLPNGMGGVDVLADMANRRVVRRYSDKPIDPALLETLCAVALSAPSKSDLQQADIVIVTDKAQREKLEALIPENPWAKAGPALLVFCGNNRRHRLLFDWRGRPFVNDYLDPFFNAAVDAGIVLATFIAAADRVGLGTCPISQIRNHAAEVAEVLGLPQHVFPVAGLGIGWPSFEGVMSPRLGLDVSIHRDRYDETGLREKVAAYDRRRNETQPYKTQRFVEKFGEDPAYGWSEDKARQYSVPERADFGAFVRAKGFKLD
ncbi:MAG: nitroreductase family protein [Reyranella sp.]|nr:nitroreductase family protein [Reyranella sp.]